MTLSAVQACLKRCFVHGQVSLQSCFVLSQQEQRLSVQGLGDFATDSKLSDSRPASFHFTVMFTRTIPNSLGWQNLHYGFTGFSSGKKGWLPCHTKSLQLVPAITDDVKLQHNQKVFCMDKVQMWCVKKRGRNMRSQSVTAAIQRAESDFCCSSTK